MSETANSREPMEEVTAGTAPPSHKRCSYCNEARPLEDFLRRTGKRSGKASRRGACRACRQQRKRQLAGEAPAGDTSTSLVPESESGISKVEAPTPAVQESTMQGLWSADAVGLAHAAEAADVDGPVHVSALDSEKPAQETGSIEETSPKKKPRKRRRKTRRNPSAIDEVSAAPQPEEGLPHPNRTAVETDGTSLLALKDRAARATREPGQPGTEPAVLSDPEAASGPAAGADAFPDAADAVEDTEGKPKKRKRRARRRRSKAKKAAPAPQTTLTPEEEAALAAAEAAARKRASTYSRPLPVAPPRPDGPEASFLRPTRTGVIRMRGRTDKGRRWYQETDLETAVTLVREHAAVVVNRSTIRRLYSNKKFRSYILNRDRYTCFFCGEYGDTIDHLLPRAKGGHTTPVNCVCACSICNQSKADRHLDDFLDSRGEAE